jgi:energy-coupling factor transporter transmembrane protein EcfT
MGFIIWNVTCIACKAYIMYIYCVILKPVSMVKGWVFITRYNLIIIHVYVFINLFRFFTFITLKKIFLWFLLKFNSLLSLFILFSNLTWFGCWKNETLVQNEPQQSYDSVSLLASSVVDHGFEPLCGQTKDNTIGISCFSVKHAA